MKVSFLSRQRLTLVSVFAVCFALSTTAVLKERDLARTLGVLRAELSMQYEQQQRLMEGYQQQGASQHERLVTYMQQCEQIGLVLFSQSADNTFDMTYACQEATDLHASLSKSGTLPYQRIIEHLQRDIERYECLINTLKSIPPVINDNDSVLTESDSILLGAIDSLEHEGVVRLDSAKVEPLVLSGEELKDRRMCLKYAIDLHDMLQESLASVEAESTYYQSVTDKVQHLYDYAQERYKVIQKGIFKDAGTPYPQLLIHLPRVVQRASSEFHDKYYSFAGEQRGFSEWRGSNVLVLTIFLIFYLVAAKLLCWLVMLLAMPKRWRHDEYRYRHWMVGNIVMAGIFAIIVMVVRSLTTRNFLMMSTGLIIDFAWLLEAVYISVFIRLKGKAMSQAMAVYRPLILMAMIVIIFRIVLIPNQIVNLIYPPVLLGFVVWQLWCSRHYLESLPLVDKLHAHFTSILMVAATVCSMLGYTLLAVQLMMWWTFLLTCIMTVACIYDLLRMYERDHILRRLGGGETPTHKQEAEQLLERMKKGEFVAKTWAFDLINRAVLPILAVLSFPYSFYWAADIFEMKAFCQEAFTYTFINQPDLVQISLLKLCLVGSLWFVFSYLNYAIRSFYVHYRKQMMKPGERVNTTLARNIISILVWGLYVIVVFVQLQVPKSGIAVVTAGLATGLGFAMQDLIENFFYGLSLMTGRVRVGDYIECDGIEGQVESITYQSTQIITYDGYVIAFLNKALFSQNFKNLTRNHRYEWVKIPVGVAYGTDIDEVRRVLEEALHPLFDEKDAAGHHLLKPHSALQVRVAGLGDSSVDLTCCMWMMVESKGSISSRIREVIYKTLNEHHIEIPFPQCDVHVK